MSGRFSANSEAILALMKKNLTKLELRELASEWNYKTNEREAAKMMLLMGHYTIGKKENDNEYPDDLQFNQ